MNEAAGATQMTDSSGNDRHGAIGSGVITGASFAGATAYRWPFASPTLPPAKPERIVTVPHDPALNPGTQDYAVTLRYRTTQPFGNIIQKGQGGAPGGYWKIENPSGYLTCVFRGVAPGGGWNRKEVVSPTKLNDGAWHTVRCERIGTQLRLWVDGALVATAGGAVGSITNDRPISIAGKLNCNQETISCDYFTGDIDFVTIGTPYGLPETLDAGAVASCSGLACTFDASTTTGGSMPLSFQWEFGDGSSSEGQWIDHTYAIAGDYAVVLTVTDAEGRVDTETVPLNVAEEIPPEQAVSHRAAATSNTWSATPSVGIPATTEAGDTLLLVLTVNDSGLIAGEPTGPDWQLLGTITQSSIESRVWWKIASSGDAGSTTSVALTAGRKAALTVASYTGADPVSPIAAAIGAVETINSPDHTTPQATTTGPSMLVSYWADKTATTTGWVPPTGQIVRSTSSGSGGGRVSMLLTDDELTVGAGLLGGLTATANGATASALMWSIALAPAPAE